jgi:hypothetical protein
VRYECGLASGIDSSPLILSSIEEERKRMRQRERQVFCLSLYEVSSISRTGLSE